MKNHAENHSPKWIDSTVRGFEALSRLDRKEAAMHWLEADAVHEPAGGFDPVAAATCSNAGAARVLLGERDLALRCFDEADRKWLRVIAQIATLDVPMTAASSSFHFRLAATVPEALINARRETYRELAETARASVRFNRHLRAPDADNAAIAATMASKLAEFQWRRPTFAAALSEDCANLEAAVLLTAPLPHPIPSTNCRGGDAADSAFIASQS